MINIAHLGLSYACNMRCPHCFVQKENATYVIENYRKIIDTLFDMGVFVIYYTYGEPLLSEKFFEVAQYCRAKGIAQVLMTNGFYIEDQEKVYKIYKAGIKKVFVSIDSATPDKHDQHRKTNGAFVHAITAIKLLCNSPISTCISCTVDSNNINEMLNIYEMGNCLEIDLISFLRLRTKQGIYQFSDEEKGIYFNNIKTMVKLAEKRKTQVYFHDNSLNVIFNNLKKKEISKEKVSRYLAMSNCTMPCSLSIAPNGDISRCALNYHVIGNISDTSLEETCNIAACESCYKR